jgi:hypothetical protein
MDKIQFNTLQTYGNSIDSTVKYRGQDNYYASDTDIAVRYETWEPKCMCVEWNSKTRNNKSVCEK